MSKKTIHGAALAAVAALGAHGPCAGQELGVRDGMAYPDVLLPTIDGERTVRLSELRGTKVLLIEFASW